MGAGGMGKGRRGIIWAVRYARGGFPVKGSLVDILGEEIDKCIDQLDSRGGEGWTSRELASLLIDGLDAGASGSSGYLAENTVAREGIRIGVPMIYRLREMADEATRKAGKGNDVARGRMRGLCQALAFIQSPTTWETADGETRREMVVAEERACVIRSAGKG